jgi:hypothetical protein
MKGVCQRANYQHRQEILMRILSLISTLLVVGSTAVTARGADLTKIDRTIAREPAFQSKPAYCLLAFGPAAKTRVWLVLDGDVLYVDRNGNGDLRSGKWGAENGTA